MLVHCWVSGALSPGCNPHFFSSRDAIGMVVGLCGVLCENCIVDASIKHTGWIAFVVCLCVFV